MKRENLLIVFIFIVLTALSACTKDGPLPDEPYAAVPYNLYPAPEEAYVGDTMPFVTDDGTLELYYLYDTDHNGQGYHPIYKYSTANLYDYSDHGMVLDFGLMTDPDPAIGTGSVIQDKEGLYHLFYTGHNDTGNSGKGKECVMHAVSRDREVWEKLPEDTFFSPENYSKDDFRDPEVFWVEEEQCYWMLIAARENTEGGVVAKYTSEDLKEWTFQGPIYAPHAQFMLECPDLFRMGDKYYLLYSWDCVTYYAMSDSLYGPFSAPEDNVLDGNGFIFYAAKSVEFNGRRYLCGWLGRSGLTADSAIYQWAGNVLNHQLVRLEDGRLGVREPETFADYFVNEKAYKAVKSAGNVKISKQKITLSASENSYALADMGTRVPSMMLECDVKPGSGGITGFAFGGSALDSAYTALCLNPAENMIHYEGTEIQDLSKYGPEAFTRFNFSNNPVHHVKLICENEIVVLYIDGEKALSSRIKHSIDGAHIALFSYGSDAEFTNLTMKTP